MSVTHQHENWQIAAVEPTGDLYCKACGQPVRDLDLDVEVSDPDDERGVPAYGGPTSRAHLILTPGYYVAFWHVSREAQGWGVFVVTNAESAYLMRTSSKAAAEQRVESELARTMLPTPEEIKAALAASRNATVMEEGIAARNRMEELLERVANFQTTEKG